MFFKLLKIFFDKHKKITFLQKKFNLIIWLQYLKRYFQTLKEFIGLIKKSWGNFLFRNADAVSA
jgi:hypothetical protein